VWVRRLVSSQTVLLPRRPQTRDTKVAALQLTQGPSLRLRKQSSVMTVEVATMLWPCGGLCLEEVRHTDVKIAQCSVWSSSSECGTEGWGKVCYL